ncbi:hypothetical protein Vi05172_g11478 [Venturia inaequalis]|nr:hypothetical protein Vi05172_g11478 [Venturia inaequalis]
MDPDEEWFPNTQAQRKTRKKQLKTYLTRARTVLADNEEAEGATEASEATEAVQINVDQRQRRQLEEQDLDEDENLNDDEAQEEHDDENEEADADIPESEDEAEIDIGNDLDAIHLDDDDEIGVDPESSGEDGPATTRGSDDEAPSSASSGRFMPGHVQRLKDSFASSSDSVEQSAHRWLTILESQGYVALLDDAMKDEAVILQLEQPIKHMGLHILASIDTNLLSVIMAGNLCEEARDHAGIKAELDRIKLQAAHAPGIYVQLFVNEDGQPPSPDLIEEMLVLMEFYCNFKPPPPAYRRFAEEVDDIKVRPAIDAAARDRTGYRAYLKRSKASQRTPSDYRTKRMRQFIKALRKRLSKIQKKDEPLLLPLAEFGYANDCLRRLASHADHKSSNYPMNLMEAVCMWAQSEGLPGFEAAWGIEQYVVFNCFEVEQGVLAEIMFSRLGHCYIYNGGGFSHYPAGLSNTSCWKKNPSFRKWYTATNYTIENTPWVENLQWNRNIQEACFQQAHMGKVEERDRWKEMFEERVRAKRDEIVQEWKTADDARRGALQGELLKSYRKLEQVKMAPGLGQIGKIVEDWASLACPVFLEGIRAFDEDGEEWGKDGEAAGGQD